MENVDKKLQNAENALQSLERSLRLYLSTVDKDIKWGYRNSVIKCFEFSIDCFWKLIRAKYNQEFKKEILPPTPKNYLKTINEMGFGEKEEVRFMLEAMDNRNLTSHSYDEGMVTMLAEDKIPHYASVMKIILQRIKKS